MLELIIAAAAAQTPAAQSTEPAPQIINMTAMRFRFVPDNITIKKGQPVILRLKSADRVHGFSIPDLHARTDVRPNQVSEVRITPEKSGKLNFFCDIFCGEDHDSMTGTITVTE